MKSTSGQCIAEKCEVKCRAGKLIAEQCEVR